MSSDPRQILLTFGDRVARVVVDELGGAAVESIFAAGSVARGEVAAFDGPEGIEIYSDIDLFVVVRDTPDLEGARRRARRAAGGVPREGDGFRIVPEPGIGVFSEEDLLSQKSRPGTVEIPEYHVMLYGNADVPKRTGDCIASKIDVSEALYLVENRLTELGELRDRLDEDRTDGFRRYLYYARSKSCLDAVSAALIAEGRFHPSRTERMRRLRDEPPDGGVSCYFPPGAKESVDRCYDRLTNLQTTMKRLREDDPSLENEVEAVLLGVWKRVAGSACALDTDEWIGLVDWRCRRGRWVENAKELWVLARRVGIPRGRVAVSAAALARFSAVDALRLSGAVEALLGGRKTLGLGPGDARAVEKGYMAGLDRLTRAFGYATGPVFRRARRLFRETV